MIDRLNPNLGPAALAGLVALVICAALVPVAVLFARRVSLVSSPTRERDVHSHSVPFLGGAAMFGGFACATVTFLPHSGIVVGVLVLCGATALMFVLDDIVKLSAFVKLAMQAALAVTAVVAFGFQIDFAYVPILRLPIHLGLVALPVTVLWIVGMKNTVNLLDGIDGLAAGVVAIVAGVLIVAEASRPGPDQRDVIIMSAALAGACGGFLIFNFHPARIFMGDSGAEFLGMALALLSILGVAKLAVGAALFVPIIALAVPIGDAVWAIVRRKRAGKSVASSDRSHIHYRLLDFGLNQRQTCVVFYGATALLGAVALTFFGHTRVLLFVAVLILLIVSTLLGDRFLVGKWRIPLPGWQIVRLILERRSARSR